MLFKKTAHYTTGRDFYLPASKADLADRTAIIYDMQVWLVYGPGHISTALANADGSFRYKQWMGNSNMVILNHIFKLLRDDALKLRVLKEIAEIKEPDLQLNVMRNLCTEYDLSGSILIADFGKDQKNIKSFLANTHSAHIESWKPFAKESFGGVVFDENGDLNGNVLFNEHVLTDKELDEVNGNILEHADSDAVNSLSMLLSKFGAVKA